MQPRSASREATSPPSSHEPWPAEPPPPAAPCRCAAWAVSFLCSSHIQPMSEATMRSIPSAVRTNVPTSLSLQKVQKAPISSLHSSNGKLSIIAPPLRHVAGSVPSSSPGSPHGCADTGARLVAVGLLERLEEDRRGVDLLAAREHDRLRDALELREEVLLELGHAAALELGPR